MSLTLTYDTQLSRVRAALTGLVDVTGYTLQRSTDETRWTTVRGGELRTPSSGALTLDDYEFSAGAENFYRLRGPQIADDYARTVAAGGWGTTTSGTDTTVVAGTTSDCSVSSGLGRIATTTANLVYLVGFDTTATNQRLTTTIGLPVVPAGGGFTLRAAVRVTDSSNYYNASVTVGTDGTATIMLTKNVAGSGSVIVSPVSIGSHAAGNRWTIVVEVSGSTVRARAWNASTTTDSGAWQVTTTDTSLTTGSLAAVGVRRETGNSNGTQTVTFDNTVVDEPRTTVFSDSITPTLTKVWLKSITRPFLNREVVVADFSAVSRRARRGVFDVVGRSAPVAVNDVRASREWTLTLMTETASEANELDLVLASGDPLFIHVPGSGKLSAVPGGYVSIGDTSVSRRAPNSARRFTDLACTEVAAPAADVVGATYTYTSAKADYATYADLAEDNDTYADLAENIGDAEDVIVG